MNKKLTVFLCACAIGAVYSFSISKPRISKVKIQNSQKQIWIDADLAVGMKRIGRPGYSDVDDGYAIAQLMKSEFVNILGFSAVFGNTSVENADSLLGVVKALFQKNEIPVYKGAASAIDLKKIETNPAVEALAQVLKTQRITILAIGPATNIGTLLLKYPELGKQIDEVILVAGRRSAEDYFKIGDQGRRAPDLNFDLDNDAFKLLFQHEVPVTLCPFEISNKVWIGERELDLLARADEPSSWLAKHSRPWLKQWTSQGEDGFNPFDALASHYIISPEDIISEPLKAHLEIHPNDMVSENQTETFKHYLICDTTEGYPVKYCYDVSPNFEEKLMDSLLK